MATYPNVNAANQYARDIVGGKILACQLTILACLLGDNYPVRIATITLACL